MQMPRVSELRDVIRLEPRSGKLFWLPRDKSNIQTSGRIAPWRDKAWNGKYAGREAFTAVNQRGYKRGIVLGHHCLAHRLVWALAHGEWPKGAIDHINRNRSDNRVSNLRLATSSQNSANRAGLDGGYSRYKGVCKNKKTDKWTAAVARSGKQSHLGTFVCETSAALAYDKAALAEFGEYALLNINRGTQS